MILSFWHLLSFKVPDQLHIEALKSMTLDNYTLPLRHWRFPDSATFGRIIPKEKFYQQAEVTPQLKKAFVEQITQIKWAHKLAESTVNLAKTEHVHEIEVIQVTLKKQQLEKALLAVIDKVIPHPTIFILRRTNLAGRAQQAYIAAHKQKVSSAKEKWQQSQYLQSAWFENESAEAVPLPTATNLQRLYEQLLAALIPDNTAQDKDLIRDLQPSYQSQSDRVTSQGKVTDVPEKSIAEKIATLAEIDALNKKLQGVKNKRDKEKQFNRRRALNDHYKALKKQLTELQTNI